MEKIDILAEELKSDPVSQDYGAVASAARQSSPTDSGAQDVAVAALLNAVDRLALAGDVEPQLVVSSFTAEEWAAAKALPDPEIGQMYDRLITSTTVTVGQSASSTFSSGMQLIVQRGVISPERANEIAVSLLKNLPMISRATELGLDFISPSDVADARRHLSADPDNPIELGSK